MSGDAVSASTRQVGYWHTGTDSEPEPKPDLVSWREWGGGARLARDPARLESRAAAEVKSDEAIERVLPLLLGGGRRAMVLLLKRDGRPEPMSPPVQGEKADLPVDAGRGMVVCGVHVPGPSRRRVPVSAGCTVVVSAWAVAMVAVVARRQGNDQSAA